MGLAVLSSVFSCLSLSRDTDNMDWNCQLKVHKTQKSRLAVGHERMEFDKEEIFFWSKPVLVSST
jgi:hypothetical protein